MGLQMLVRGDDMAKLVDSLLRAAGDVATWTEVIEAILEYTGAESGALVGRSGAAYPFKVLAAKMVDSSTIGGGEEGLFSRMEQSSNPSLLPSDVWVGEHRRCYPVTDGEVYLLLDYGRRASRRTNGSEANGCIDTVLSCVSRAVQLSNLVSKSIQKADFLRSVMEAVPVGFCIVDESGVLVQKNDVAGCVLDASPIIKVSRYNDLRALNVTAKVQLRKAIMEVARGYSGSQTLLLTCPDHREKLLLDVSACDAESTGLLGRRHYACITIVDPEIPFALSVDRLRALYKLSFAEICVTELMLLGYTGKEMARSRGVSPETIRAQLKSISAKTGVSSRVEVASLVHRLCWTPSRQVCAQEGTFA